MSEALAILAIGVDQVQSRIEVPAVGWWERLCHRIGFHQSNVDQTLLLGFVKGKCLGIALAV